MLRLSTTPAKQEWITLMPGVRVEVKPRSVVAIIAARAAATEAYRANDEADEADRQSDITVAAASAMVVTYAKQTIIAWDGVGDDAGEPAPVTPENIEAAMGVWPFYRAFDEFVLTPALSLPADSESPA